MNGLEATRELRKIGYPYLIIGVTDNVMDKDVKEFIQAGVDLVLHKPFDIALLERLLHFIQCNGSLFQCTSCKRLMDDASSDSMCWKHKM